MNNPEPLSCSRSDFFIFAKIFLTSNISRNIFNFSKIGVQFKIWPYATASGHDTSNYGHNTVTIWTQYGHDKPLNIIKRVLLSIISCTE